MGTRNVNGQVRVALPGGQVVFNESTSQYLVASNNIPLQGLDGMPGIDYRNVVKGRILDGWDHRRFDTRVCIAGQTIAAGDYAFFDKKKNDSSEPSLDGSITVARKDLSYTNMIEEGKIEGGYSLIVESIQVDFIVTHRDFNAFVANTGQPSTFAPSATDTNSASNTVVGFCRSSYLEFASDRETFAEGRLDDYPSERFVSCQQGGATSEGVVQVGIGIAKMMRNIVVLQESHHFDVTLHVYRAVTSPLAFELGIALCGTLVQVGNG